MFKYSPINSYSLQNLHNSQIYFNNPLDFNDPFDTFHPATVGELSNEKFVSLFCRIYRREFEEKTIIKILNGQISKDELYDFSKEHIDYFFDFDKNNENVALHSKENFLSAIEQEKEKSTPIIIEELFISIKIKLEDTIRSSIEKTRDDLFSKIGVSCFSKNNSNLLMWSHYADSHKGFCLEFDSNLEPFSKSFEVIYNSNIPTINSDLLLDDKLSLESFKKLLSYKSIDWKHEDELRLLHQEKNKIFRYPRHALKSIYFGIKITQADVEIVCSLLKTNNAKIRFFRMKRLESSFGIIPEEFFYSTPIEVQSKLIMEILNKFKGNEFKIEELFEDVKIDIQQQNLVSHLDEMARLGILTKSGTYYQLKI
ncbi:DUF2971 domain-containing protein [Flavobacteriaceae bacterium KMM 6897]|nr:DUF2971 domain-containing protein [Flavobacteriaceae bacterium KMM 6897]